MADENGAGPRLFRVVFSGGLLPGRSQDEVRAHLAGLHKCDSAKIDRLFAGHDVVVASNMTIERAQAARRSYAEAGAELRIEEQPPSPSRPAAIDGVGGATHDPAAPRVAATEGSAPGASSNLEAAAFMTCPACGFRQSPAAVCARCGLVFAKYQGGGRRSQPDEVQAPKPSEPTGPGQTSTAAPESETPLRASMPVLVASLLEATVAGGGVTPEARQIASELRAAGASHLAVLRRVAPIAVAVVVLAVAGTLWLFRRGAEKPARTAPAPPPGALNAPATRADDLGTAVARLEDCLYRSAPTTQVSLVMASGCTASIRDAIAKSPNGFGGSAQASAAADEALRAFQRRLSNAALYWNESSSLVVLRGEWVTLRTKHFGDGGKVRQPTLELDQTQAVRLPSEDFAASDVLAELEIALSEADGQLRQFALRLEQPDSRTTTEHSELSGSFFAWVSEWRSRYGRLGAPAATTQREDRGRDWTAFGARLPAAPPTLHELDAQRIGAGAPTDLQSVLSGMAAGRRAVHEIGSAAGTSATVRPADLLPACEKGLRRVSEAREALARLDL